jgi:3-methyladenine DNA glycosylase/8-oxoguanine DNA glycosylase
MPPLRSADLDYHDAALKHLCRDKKLRQVITRVGAFTPRPTPPRDYFRVLTGSVISQMISTTAARTIRARLIEKLKPAKVTPQAVLRLKIPDLRQIGLSNTKAQALLDLADRAQRRVLPLQHFHKFENEQIIENLVEVRGIGPWTAHMFLMFALVRPDVWPVDDLGIRAAVKRLDGLAEMPSRGYLLQRGEAFAPYRTVASWYLWQSLTLK